MAKEAGKSLIEFKISDNVGIDAAKMVSELSKNAIKERGSFRVALSGGSFPKNLGKGFDELIKNKKLDIDFTKWKIFWADERCVKLTNKDSNYLGFNDEILKRLPKNNTILAKNIYAIDEFNEPKLNENENEDKKEDKKNDEWIKIVNDLSKKYEIKLLKEFNIKDNKIIPSFDCIFLGMGEDGHTASLFPKHKLLNSNKIIDGLIDSPKMPPQRITMSLPLICNSKNIIFVATGKGKQDAIKNIVDCYKKGNQQTLPSGIVTQKAKGKVVWLLDKSAAETAKL